jgi:DNA-binding response OmpR family regulator
VRILLIEDDERVVSFLKRGLEAEGYTVDVASDGETGQDMAASAYSLIILDLVLPKTTGVSITQRLRAQGNETPILMLTGKDTVSDKVAGLSAGADDYLTKPFAFEELLARIEALLRRGPYHRQEKILQVADLVLNPETREVTRGGLPLHLTTKEFTLLRLLMSQANKPVSRARILEHVWGAHRDPLTNTVDVYIGYLRKKIDAGSATKLIQTVRDFGYKISAAPL